ncbi:serine hydrolase [Chitinophaga caseinilytica]|uniref:serine hydrolase n=1 Tax=Chitinophaga caseinilytica TaxID=2267521 RepID=UPI003C2AB459
MSRILVTLCFLVASLAAGAQSSIPERLSERIPALMVRDRIPGLSIAYIEKGQVAWVRHFGVASKATGEPVRANTRFEAASLTKVVTAYMAMQLAGSRQLDPDKPLRDYLGNNDDVGDDPRFAAVTARRVLTHTAGFPNWRDSEKLMFLFAPGERFEYSGEGFVLLSKAMEKITGKSYAELAEDSVFTPLEMIHSSMVYDTASRQLYAPRHNWLGETAYPADYTNVNAAYSLRTTATDYALFLSALLSGKKFDRVLFRDMMRRQSFPDPKESPDVAWGLGIGLDSTSTGRYAWHWGDQGDSKALFVVDIDRQEGIVYFTNSANGLSPAADILAIAPGGNQSGIVKWVKYDKFDPAAETLLLSIRNEGAAKAMKAYVAGRKEKFPENVLNMLGYALLREKKTADAIAVFTQNTTDHPESANVWDSLGEAYMENGDKPSSIINYEKSLRINPNNGNAAQQLKKLRGK